MPNGRAPVERKGSAGTPLHIEAEIKLDPNSGFEEIYNGQFPLVLWRSKKPSKRRVVSLRIKELRVRNPKLLKPKHSLEELNRLFGPDSGTRPRAGLDLATY